MKRPSYHKRAAQKRLDKRRVAWGRGCSWRAKNRRATRRNSSSWDCRDGLMFPRFAPRSITITCAV